MVKKPDLTARLGHLTLPNPVMLASGTCSYGIEMEPYGDIAGLGAIVVKGLSLKPSAGNPPPRIAETPSGMLNAIGLENIGVEAFLKDKLPLLRRKGARVIANIYGETVEDYRRLAGILDDADGVIAMEVNISCPNVKKGGLLFGQDPRETGRVVAAVRRATDKPLLVKLTPNVTSVPEIARAAEGAGADALTKQLVDHLSTHYVKQGAHAAGIMAMETLLAAPLPPNSAVKAITSGVGSVSPKKSPSLHPTFSGPAMVATYTYSSTGIVRLSSSLAAMIPS